MINNHNIFNPLGSVAVAMAMGMMMCMMTITAPR